jgi:hypothetical protein
VTERRFVLVRMEQIGEPCITPDGQSLVHVRLPWFRETDGCWAISLKDIARDAASARSSASTPSTAGAGSVSTDR